MHTSTAAMRDARRSRAAATSASLVRRTASAENCPLAGAGWLVAMASMKPASCSARIPSTAPGEQAQLVRVERDGDGARLLVAHDVDDRPVAIEDRDGPFTSTLSHFVAERWSCGWLTSRCQTTAAKPSVCGVMRSAATVGMTTHASATCLV